MFLAGGVWLMARSLAEICTGNALQQTGLQQGGLQQLCLQHIGMVSVRQIVDKYQGICQIWEEGDQVRQKLILVQ